MLAAIHFYWALGGDWGFAHALPTTEQGERVLNPTKLESALVGLGLTAFGLFYLIKSGFISVHLPHWIEQLGGWIIPAIFLLRAIGDFKYAGFFKSIRQTDFGTLDTMFYSPLCLLIALLGISLVVLK